METAARVSDNRTLGHYLLRHGWCWRLRERVKTIQRKKNQSFLFNDSTKARSAAERAGLQGPINMELNCSLQSRQGIDQATRVRN
eukprot:1157401-Pelagomonas_calceolata.AAC.3